MLNKLTKTQGLSTLASAIAITVCAEPLRAETHELVIGKTVLSVAFPCTPQRQKQLIANVLPNGEDKPDRHRWRKDEEEVHSWTIIGCVLIFSEYK